MKMGVESDREIKLLCLIKSSSGVILIPQFKVLIVGKVAQVGDFLGRSHKWEIFGSKKNEIISIHTWTLCTLICTISLTSQIG
jgi:hypothetical protein